MRGSIARRSRPARRRPAPSLAGAARGAVALVATLGLLAGCSSGGSDGHARHDGARARKKRAAPSGPAWNTRPRSIASVGDSITRGFDACSVLSDCPEVSWSTGSKVDSLARRLLPADGSAARHATWNEAQTGATVADLPGQIRAAVRHKPQLVTVLIGANDACQRSVSAMTPPATFRRDFAAAMRTLRHDLPRTQVYVASLPDLKRLWSEGRRSMLGKEIWKLGICPSMLKDADATDPAATQRRTEVEQRVDAYDDALRDVCDHDALCRYDGAVHDYRFTTTELSAWDWFHPSKAGQQQLAALAYREITRKEPTT